MSILKDINHLDAKFCGKWPPSAMFQNPPYSEYGGPHGQHDGRQNHQNIVKIPYNTTNG
jgi:hypothetical protein